MKSLTKTYKLDHVRDEDLPAIGEFLLQVMQENEGEYVKRDYVLERINYLRILYTNREDPYKDVELREALRILRNEGYLILSKSGSKGGYKFSESLDEVKDFLGREFRSRAMSLLGTLGVMKRSAEREYGGQLRFDLPDPDEAERRGEETFDLLVGDKSVEVRPCPACGRINLTGDVNKAVVSILCEACYLRGPGVNVNKLTFQIFDEALLRAVKLWNKLPRTY